MSPEWLGDGVVQVTSIVLFCVQILGILTAIHALQRVRTAQATTAWCVGLITLPLVVVPGYWIFGRSKFFGYRQALRRLKEQHSEPSEQYRQMLKNFTDAEDCRDLPLHELARVVDQPVTRPNRLKLLIDGDATFKEMLATIRQAQEYILVQFFIIEDDRIGNEFAEALIAKARQGVRCYLLYDDIGCQWLPDHYLESLRQAGVVVSSFSTRTGLYYRLQVNFRNHRKVLIVDGKTALAGGLNLGDEYRDGGRRFQSWRDTHMRVDGPGALALQSAFSMDWYWSRREVIDALRWWIESDVHVSPKLPGSSPESEDRELETDPSGRVLVIPTGPADRKQRCTMMFCEMAALAKRRIWISSPYFVPNEAVATALETATARGVEVRVLIPDRPDHLLVYLAGHYYESQLTEVGIQVNRYKPGFLHQKAILIDDCIAAVGSTNLDNRSLLLNFEMMVATSDPEFVADVEKMLENDFNASERTPFNALEDRPYWFRVVVGVARLFSPVL